MKLSKKGLIILGVSSGLLLIIGSYMFIKSRIDKNKNSSSEPDVNSGNNSDFTPITNPNTEPSGMTYSECNSKNPFKNKDEIIAFQKYAISQGYKLGAGGKDKDGADGDYGCKTNDAYTALKDSYKKYLSYQSSIPKTQNDARQKAISGKNTSYLWDGNVYSTSTDKLLMRDPRGKKLILNSNANQVNVRLVATNNAKVLDGVSNYLGVIKNKGGKEIGHISNYYYNDSEKIMYYVVNNFIITLFDPKDLNKPIVNPKNGFISGNSSKPL